jgi:predicted aldo/keto reductase-like oxidoreductase
MKVMRGGMFGQGANQAVPDWDAEKLARLPGAAIRYLLQDERVHTFNIGMRLKSDVDANVKILSGDATFTEDDRLLLAEYSTRAYPWYEERFKEWQKQWEKQQAEPDTKE